jgi:hypothetical protein
MPRDMLCRCDWKQSESITATDTPAAPIRPRADDESHERESIGDTTSAATDDEVPRASPITDATHSRTTQQRRFISTPQLSGALFMQLPATSWPSSCAGHKRRRYQKCEKRCVRIRQLTTTLCRWVTAEQQPKGVSMKVLSIVVIVIACLVSACSSSQQQSSRDRSDKEVTMAFLDEQIGPSANPANWHQIPATSTPRDGTLVGSCCNP